jgi:hypothetical protein
MATSSIDWQTAARGSEPGTTSHCVEVVPPEPAERLVMAILYLGTLLWGLVTAAAVKALVWD